MHSTQRTSQIVSAAFSDKQSAFCQQVHRIHADHLLTDGDCSLSFNRQTSHAQHQYKGVLTNRFLKLGTNTMGDNGCSTYIPPRGVGATPIVAIHGYQHRVTSKTFRVATNHRNLDDALLPATLAVAAPLPLPACHLTGRSGT